LDSWWNGRASDDVPALIVGLDGVGKIWAAMDWLLDRGEPIVIVIPSSSVAGASFGSALSIKRFVADRLGAKGQVGHRSVSAKATIADEGSPYGEATRPSMRPEIYGSSGVDDAASAAPRDASMGDGWRLAGLVIRRLLGAIRLRKRHRAPDRWP
jgi:hypothetical protein